MIINNDKNTLFQQAAMNNIPIIANEDIELPLEFKDKIKILTYKDLDDDNYNIGDCIVYNGKELLIWLLDRFYGLTPVIGRIKDSMIF